MNITEETLTLSFSLEDLVENMSRANREKLGNTKGWKVYNAEHEYSTNRVRVIIGRR